MIKLIVSDIDGTLANSKGEIDPDIFEIIPELKRRGIEFVPASGRPYENIAKRFAQVSSDLMIISDNGAMIVNNGNIMSVNSFKKELLNQLIEYGHKRQDCTMIATGLKMSYIENGNEEFMDYVKQFFTKSMLVENLFDVEDEIIKYTICSIEHDMNDIYNDMFAFHNLAELTIAGANWLDVNPKGVSKGNAVKTLQKMLNIKAEETMAFGDYMNDYEMLQSVYYSCAPSNACDEIKKIAREIVPSNDEKGVTRTIRKLIID